MFGCPMTLSFHLIFKFQKVTKLFGRSALHPSPSDSLLIMTQGVNSGYCSETDHSINAGRYLLLLLLMVHKLIELGQAGKLSGFSCNYSNFQVPDFSILSGNQSTSKSGRK